MVLVFSPFGRVNMSVCCSAVPLPHGYAPHGPSLQPLALLRAAAARPVPPGGTSAVPQARCCTCRRCASGWAACTRRASRWCARWVGGGLVHSAGLASPEADAATVPEGNSPGRRHMQFDAKRPWRTTCRNACPRRGLMCTISKAAMPCCTLHAAPPPPVHMYLYLYLRLSPCRTCTAAAVDAVVAAL